MKTPSNLKYTKADEWFDPDTGAMGLTDYAQSQLSDIVFLEILVDVGETLEAGKAIASVEFCEGVGGNLRLGCRQGDRGQQGSLGEA